MTKYGNFIGVGDLIINKEERYIGVIQNKYITYDEDIFCSILIDFNQSKSYFGLSMNKFKYVESNIQKLSLINPYYIYNNKIIKPKLNNLIKTDEIKFGRIVKIVDKNIFKLCVRD